jgi:hypothetical protein
MAFDDLPLDRPSSSTDPEPPSRPPSLLRWLVVALAGVVVGALLMFWWMSRAQPTPAVPPSPTAKDVAMGSNRPKRQAIDLPALGDSDGLIRTLVGNLSRHPTISRLLATSGLVRATALAVVQIGDGRTPVGPLEVIKPAGRLQLLGTTTGRIDPASYRRWDPIVGGLVSIAPTDAAQLYVNVKPLLDEAYIDLGHPGEDFDAAIVRAIQMLADTPVLTDPVLVKRPTYFEHDDPAMRTLRPVQKQLILMGPENQRRLVAWLKSFAGALDLKIE